MIVAVYVCEDCGKSFEVQIFEPGEAEKKRLPVSHVRCKECGSPNVKRVK